MDKMRKKHISIGFWTLGVLVAYVCTAWLVNRLFKVIIPPQILLVAVSACMAVDVYMRITFWKKRDEFLTAEEVKSNEAKIFLMVIPAEILFVLLCIGSVFAD